MKQFLMLIAMLHLILTPFAEAQGASNAQSVAMAYSQLMDNPILPITESSLQKDAVGATALLNSNSDINNSALGARLRSEVNRINNFESIKKGFASCALKDNTTKQSLLAIEATMSPKDVCICKINGGDPLAGANEAIRLSTFQNEVSKNALRDAVDAYYGIEMKYGNAQPGHIADTLCGGPAGGKGDQCNGQDRKMINDRLATLNGGPKPQHLDDFHEFFTLNHGIAAANNDLGFIEPQATLTHPVIDQKIKDQYAQYERDYMMTANLPSGFLLSTQTMQDYFGGFRRLPEDLHRSYFTYEFDQHHISNDGTGTENGAYGPDVVMKNAINEELSTTAEQVQTIAKQDAVKARQEETSGAGQVWRNPDKSKDDLEYLLNTNPQAIAKALLNNPGMTGDVCGIIQKTQADNARHAVYHKIAVYGAIALGVAAAAFGLWELAVPGAVVAGAGVGAIAAVAGAAGAGVELGNAAGDYQENKARMLALQNQILEHTNVDEQTVRDYTTAVSRLNDDVNTMVLSAAGVGVGVVLSVPSVIEAREALEAARTGRALTAPEEIAAARNVDAAVQDINAASRAGRPVSAALQKMTQATDSQETANLVSELSDVNPETRVKLIGKLDDISGDPKKVKTLERALQNAEKSCGP